MKLAQNHLIVAAVAIVMGLGVAIAGEDANTPKPARATPEQAKKIKALIDDLNTKELDVSKDGAVDKLSSGEELIGMGAVAIPYITEAIQSTKRSRFATKCYLVTALGRIAKDEQVNVIGILCRLLEGWVTNPRINRGGEAMDVEGANAGWVYASVYKWSKLPLAAISVLTDLKDPKCVPTLTKVMTTLRQKADTHYTTFEKRENQPAEFAVDVMQACANALVAMEDSEANKYLEKCTTSLSPSLRLLGNIAKATQLLAEDKKAAEEYLRKQAESEKVSKVSDEYKRFIMEKCKSWDEKEKDMQDLKDKVKGTSKDDKEKDKEKDKEE